GRRRISRDHPPRPRVERSRRPAGAAQAARPSWRHQPIDKEPATPALISALLMTDTGATMGLDEFPPVLPIFPLSGALLLSNAHLPLNIFEPRYLAMVQDAMATNRLIGMVQPRDPNSRLSPPEVFHLGRPGQTREYGAL